MVFEIERLETVAAPSKVGYWIGFAVGGAAKFVYSNWKDISSHF